MYSDCWTYPKEKIDAMIKDLEDKIDSGGSGGGSGSDIIIVNAVEVDGTVTLDKTWQEIHDALKAKKLVFLSHEYTVTVGDDPPSIDTKVCMNQLPCAGIYEYDGPLQYYVSTLTDGDWYFETDSPDGYPVSM